VIISVRNSNLVRLLSFAADIVGREIAIPLTIFWMTLTINDINSIPFERGWCDVGEVLAFADELLEFLFHVSSEAGAQIRREHNVSC